MYLVGKKRPIGEVCIATKIHNKTIEADLEFRDLPLQSELGFPLHASSSKTDSSHVLVFVFLEINVN
jgi:hypothetical protein